MLRGFFFEQKLSSIPLICLHQNEYTCSGLQIRFNVILSLMKSLSRRHFIQTTGLLLASSVAGKAFDNKQSLKLSFSTLGCPDWPFTKIVEFAVANGYTGLELRGILRQMDLPLCPEFSKENISATLSLMKQNGLRFVDLGSSCKLHISDTVEREKNMDEARRFIDLAQQIDCPFIRVFPNNLPKEEEKQKTLDRIALGLQQLAEYSKATNVTVLMETHGDLVYTDDLINVMQAVNHKHAALIWDVTNMWTITKESVADVYYKLKT